jgi:amino acid adenylation domain-containing protein
LRQVVGFLSNVVPVRLAVDESAPFSSLMQHTGVRVREAFRHQRYWGGAIRRDLALAANQPNIFGTMMNFVPADAERELAGRPVVMHAFANSRRAEDLMINFNVRRDADMEVQFSGHASNYDSIGLQRHVQRFLQLLGACAVGADRPIERLALLPAAERSLILDDWGIGRGSPEPAASMIAQDQSFMRLFEAQCERSPHAVAVGFNGDTLTYAALNEASNRIARRLNRAGLGPGDVVAVCMGRSPLLLASLLAIQKSAAAFLPLDPDFPVERLAYMLADSGARLVLSGGAIPAGLALPHGVRSMDVSVGDAADGAGEVARTAPALELAYVIYTSGSTGRPKGVAISHTALCANLRSMQQRLNLTATDVVAATTTVSFDPAFVELFLPLMVGARIELVPRETAIDGRELAAWLAATRPTLLQATPTTWRSLLNSDWHGDRSLRALSGGEVMHRDLADALLPRSAEVWNLYGPTETTIWSALCKVERGPEKTVPIGQPIAGMKYYILDATLEPAPIGTTGELYIAGTGLGRGYLNRPALTADRFVPDPHGGAGALMYRSGDLARWRADGNIDYLGRNDQQVKLRGSRIELGEIEAVLRELKDVEEAAVVVRGAGDTEHLAAYVVRRGGAEIDTARWRLELAARLPGYMVPSVFVSLRAMPLTPSGKLDRRALPAAAPIMPGRSYEPPQTPTERRIESIWRQVLRVERIGREDGFFELGGHSLAILQVASRLRDEFGLELPLQILFGARTLASMAEQIDRALTERVDAPRLPALVATEWSGPAPLSLSQERMWLIQSLTPTTTAYNIVVCLKLRGELDVEALSRSFDELMRRHEILRTRICLVEDQPRQVVESWHAGALEIIGLQGRHAEAEVARRASVQARTPFDLLQGSILRARLYRLNRDLHVLTFIVHHIAADQWSMGILGRELAALYNARRRGESPKLDALPVSYRDYALWQRRRGSEVEFDRQLAYWRRRLANLPTVDLPTDRPRPKIWTLRGATHDRPLKSELLFSIEQFTRSADCTLFMVFFAAFVALLHRITGQTDIAVGVPVANRTHSAVEGLVGTFVNTVVLRNDLTGNPSFGELVRRLKDTAVEAFDAQDVSFERLVQELGQRADPGRTPLVQVLFNVVNAPMHGIEFEGLTWEPISIDAGGAQFELSFTIDAEVTHMLSVAYSTDLFDPATIERLVGQYLTLVSAAIAAPKKRIGALPLLPEEQLAMLRHWNDTASPWPRMQNLVTLFEATAAEFPDAPAISVGEARLNYAELNEQANRLAAVLRTVHVDRSALVAVCITRSPLLLIGLLAIQKCGAAYLPLDPEFPAERLSYMLADSGARLLLTSVGLPSGMRIPEGVQVLEADVAANGVPAPSAGPTGPPEHSTRPRDTAYVIYTSGSTGRPKGVAVSHGAMMNFLYSMLERPGLTEGDVLAAVTTISFDIAVLELYLPLMVGARIELVPRQTASEGRALARLLKSSGATMLQATPATWRMLLEAGWSGSNRFRALSGGEALSRQLADSLLKCVGELWNLYGPTETTVWSTIDRVEWGTAPISIGRPIANTQVHILDAAGETLPVGVVGEICIGGDGVADGYHRRPALTAERFVPDGSAAAAGRRLYRSGDLGRWGADGKLYHLGRGDTQVKIRGFRIELGEIERVLEEQAEVLRAVVVVRDAQVDDPRLIAYATYRAGQDLTTGDVKGRLRRRLPEYMIPSMVVPLLSMPLTPNGKTDRAALPDPFKNPLHAMPGREPAATEIEQIIGDIWKAVLKIDSVGVNDNFFDLGGYSLLSLRVVKLIERRTGRRMDPRVLFFNDLRQVAALLEREPAATASSDV